MMPDNSSQILRGVVPLTQRTERLSLHHPLPPFATISFRALRGRDVQEKKVFSLRDEEKDHPKRPMRLAWAGLIRRGAQPPLGGPIKQGAGRRCLLCTGSQDATPWPLGPLARRRRGRLRPRCRLWRRAPGRLLRMAHGKPAMTRHDGIFCLSRRGGLWPFRGHTRRWRAVCGVETLTRPHHGRNS